MERKEAISILKYQYDYGQMEQSVHKALGMAIASLETDEAYQLEYERTTKNDLGVDLVSRADVLQILLDYDYANENALVLKDIKELPSVTPQEPQDSAIRVAISSLEEHSDLFNDLKQGLQEAIEYEQTGGCDG